MKATTALSRRAARARGRQTPLHLFRHDGARSRDHPQPDRLLRRRAGAGRNGLADPCHTRRQEPDREPRGSRTKRHGFPTCCRRQCQAPPRLARDKGLPPPNRHPTKRSPDFRSGASFFERSLPGRQPGKPPQATRCARVSGMISASAAPKRGSRPSSGWPGSVKPGVDGWPAATSRSTRASSSASIFTSSART